MVSDHVSVPFDLSNDDSRWRNMGKLVVKGGKGNRANVKKKKKIPRSTTSTQNTLQLITLDLMFMAYLRK